MINLFQPSVGNVELAAIRDVFSSSWLGTGDRVADFERVFAEYIGRLAPEVVAVTSCTEGLFQAVAALGLTPGDAVILPSISFIGAAHAVRTSGAEVVLCDVDPITLNPTVEHVERVITPEAKAVLILHYGGAPGDVAKIAELAARRSLLLIEDAACSLGSFEDERACGTFGDVGVWSFDSMKVLTTADGGMVWCRNPAITDGIRNGVKLGVGSSGFGRATSPRWWEIEPVTIGRRAAMNDVAAAMGLVQLAQLSGFLCRRRDIAATYDVALGDLSWLMPPKPRAEGAAHTFYWIQTGPDIRDRLAEHLLERQIYTTFRYWPLHRTSMYRCDAAFAGADQAADSTLLLPLHQALSDADVERVVDAIRSFRP